MAMGMEGKKHIQDPSEIDISRCVMVKGYGSGGQSGKECQELPINLT